MSRKLTAIKLPGQTIWAGLGDWGEVDREAMIAKAREEARAHRRIADMLDAAADEDFRITLDSGTLACRTIKVIQEGKKDG